jgi:O-acetyl-ADP-ribose deacetylase (regulator of RNase III)
MHTKSYMKNCDYIIHAVGPNSDNYKGFEQQCYETLEDTFVNVFKYADKKLKSSSIALPLISSGIFGVPKEECCKRLYNAINIFISTTKNRVLKCIKVVSIDNMTNIEIVDYFTSKLNKKIINENRIESTVVVLNDPPKEVVKDVEPTVGKCSVCDGQTKIKLILDCKCQYCAKCVKNYYDNSNKCECPEYDGPINPN